MLVAGCAVLLRRIALACGPGHLGGVNLGRALTGLVDRPIENCASLHMSIAACSLPDYVQVIANVLLAQLPELPS